MIWVTAWRKDEARYALSDEFQWLPTDVEVGENGDAVFLSYVNNLHPVTHRELASVLPVLFGRMRPLFENVLTDLRHPRPPRIAAYAGSWYVDEPVPPSDDDDDALRAWQVAWADWTRNRSPVPPDAPAFTPPTSPGDSARVDLRARRLQVIVKLATVHLTPDAGRALAFPNIFQHRVDPFRLADPSRPGHRKILAFFLVDPSVTIVSTSDVPPQQPWSPTSTMTLEQAKEFRSQLMRERKFFVDEHNEQIYEREFSLCEH